MSFRRSSRQIERLEAELDAESGRASERAAAAHRAKKAAKKFVGIWNGRLAVGAELWFHPTIQAAITAGCPMLRFYCPGCSQVGRIDLRKLDRHRGATIESLIPALYCRRCQPHPPFTKLIGLAVGVPKGARRL